MKAVMAAPVLVTALSLSLVAFGGAGPRSANEPEPGTSAAPSPAEAAASASARFHAVDLSRVPHNFYFTRAMYGGGGNFRGSRWAVDYPQADHWISTVLGRLTGVDVFRGEHTVQLDDPNLARFPFIYAVEVGSMGLSPGEIDGLRNYLLKGGFLMADDFWGSYEWAMFEDQMRRVLPEYEIVELPLEHEIFSTFYAVKEIVQVPNVDQGIRGGRTHEQDGYVPRCLGIFDEKGRLMVVINWNTDLGDAWEWAEEPLYPLTYSTYAYQMAANFVIYALTH